MNLYRPWSLSLALLALLATGTASAEEGADIPCGSPEAIQLRVEPQTIPVGLFYGGSELRVTADVPSGSQVAVVVRGKSEHLALKKKGKVWGVLWMNVGDLEYDSVPGVYLLATSAPVRELADTSVLARHEIGYDALSSSAGGDASMFGEVVKLMENDGLFWRSESGASLTASGEASHLEAVFPVRSRVPASRYDVRVIAFNRQGASCLASTTVTLEQVGAAKSLRTLAIEHGLAYGIIAVVVALLAGLATGLIFGKGASKGH